MRRTASSYLRFLHRIRIISAHAENSISRAIGKRNKQDHLRACGEQVFTYLDLLAAHGSSPRMRRTVKSHRVNAGQCRIISAHAENSVLIGTNFSAVKDHLRACGEQGFGYNKFASYVGSSPRMRRTVRDNPYIFDILRIISAHAENSLPPYVKLNISKDHLRACGEQTKKIRIITKALGSSPRMRRTALPILP